MAKFFSISRSLFCLLLIFACVPINIESPQVTNVSIVDDQLIVKGSNFVNIQGLALSDSGGKKTFQVTSVSQSQIIGTAVDNKQISVPSILNLIIDTAQGQSTYPVSFSLQNGAVTTGTIASQAITPSKFLGITTDDPPDQYVLTWSGITNSFFFGPGGGGGSGSGEVAGIILGPGIVGEGPAVVTGTVPISVNIGESGDPSETIIPHFNNLNKIVMDSSSLPGPDFSGLRFQDGTGSFDMFNDGALTIKNNTGQELFVLDYNGALTVDGETVCLSNGNCISGPLVTALPPLIATPGSSSATTIISAGNVNTANNLVQLDNTGSLISSIGGLVRGPANSTWGTVPYFSDTSGDLLADSLINYQNIPTMGAPAGFLNTPILSADAAKGLVAAPYTFPGTVCPITQVLRSDGVNFICQSVADGVTSFNGRIGAVSSTDTDYTASQIENDPFLLPSGNIDATNVQAAINELDSEKLSLAGGKMTGTIVSQAATSLQVGPFGVNPGETGEIHFEDLQINGSNYVGFKAPDDVITNIVWTLPAGDGATGTVLTTNGNKVLSWTSAGSGGIGDVVGPSSSLQNGIALFADGSGKLLKDSQYTFPPNPGLVGQYLAVGGAQDLVWTSLPSSMVQRGGTSVISENLPKFDGTAGTTIIDSGIPSADVPTMSADPGGLNRPIVSTGAGKTLTSANYSIPIAGPLSLNQVLQYDVGSTAAIWNTISAAQVTNSSSPNISATNVQQAINELDTKKLALAGGTMTGILNLANTSEVRFLGSVGYVGLKAPAAVATDTLWSLPIADGTNGQVLSTNGLGALSWSSNTPVNWQANFDYNTGDWVVYEQDIYLAKSSHNSSAAFSTDLTAGLWGLISPTDRSTGAVIGGDISISGNNLIITGGIGLIIDSYSDPGIRKATRFDYNGATLIPPNTPSTNFYIQVDRNASPTVPKIVNGDPTAASTKDEIILGIGTTDENGNLALGGPFRWLSGNVDSKFQNFMLNTGMRNITGNIISPASNNLKLSSNAGVIEAIGANFSNPKFPNELETTQQNSFFFKYSTSRGILSVTTDQIDPNNYEPNGLGAIATVTTGKFTIQRIYLGANNQKVLMYGQNEYTLLDDASAAAQTEDFVVNPVLASDIRFLYRGYLIVQQGATDLSNPTMARISNCGKYGCAGVGTSTGAVATGDVSGPSGATSENIVTFNGNTGKIIQDSGLSTTNLVTSSANFAEANRVAISGGTTRAITQTGYTIPSNICPIGQVLKSNGTNFVCGPAISSTTPTTTNAIARFSGTDGNIKNSGITIDDLNNVTGIASLASGNFTNAGNLVSNGNMSIDSGTLSVDASTNQVGVNGTLSTTGNASMGGTFTVSGATTLSNSLAVTGVTTLGSSLGVSGPTTLNSSLAVNGVTNLNLGLAVAGTTTLNAGTFPNDYGSVGQVLQTNGMGGLFWADVGVNNISNAGTSTVNAIAKFASADGKSVQNSGVIISSTNDITGIGAFTSSGNMTVDGNTLFVDSSGNKVGIGMTPVRTFDVTGTFGVTGAANLGSTLGITGATTINSTLAVLGNMTVGAQSELRLTENTALGTEYYSIKSPSNMTSNLSWILPITQGTNGQFLQNNGAGILTWASIAVGDVTSAGTSTDNAIARFDQATGKIIQNSGVIIDDSKNISGVANLTSAGTFTNTGSMVNNGNFTVDSSTFFVDATNNRVGIMDITPTATLDITGNLATTSGATIGSTLSVAGSTTLSSSLSLAGAAALNSTVAVAGSTILSSTLDVTGASTLNSTLAVKGLMTINADGTNNSTFPTNRGTNLQVLQTNGAGTLSWATVGLGDVVGPASSTDNTVARFNLTTGKLIQNSGVTISDSNNVSGIADLLVDVDTFFVDSLNNRVEIGNNIPGTTGIAKLQITGGNASSTGPHIQMTTSADPHPLRQLLNLSHDGVYDCFDCYYDGTVWKSSSASSSFRIYKDADEFIIGAVDSTSAGGTITPGNNLVINQNGYISMSNSLTINNNGSNSSTFPTTRGTSGQVLTTDGAGTLSWSNPGGAAGGGVATISNLGTSGGSWYVLIDDFLDGSNGTCQISIMQTDQSRTQTITVGVSRRNVSGVIFGSAKISLDMVDGSNPSENQNKLFDMIGIGEGDGRPRVALRAMPSVNLNMSRVCTGLDGYYPTTNFGLQISTWTGRGSANL